MKQKHHPMSQVPNDPDPDHQGYNDFPADEEQSEPA